MKKKRVLFISSTGGHLDELMQLKPMFDKYNYYIVSEKTKSTVGLRKKFPKKVSLLVYGTKKNMFTYPFVLLINSILSLCIYIKHRPKFIISTGSHTAGPMCCIGKLFGSKIIFIESFANMTSKTVTGRIVYHFADVFIVQWDSMKKFYPKAIVSKGVF